MTTHSYTGADATINHTEYLTESGGVLATRHMGVFTNSDLSNFLPLSMDDHKSFWDCGRCYFSSATYQPKAEDVPSDGSGNLTLTVTNVVNAGWYQFFRLLPETLWIGNDTVQNANGLYLDFDFEFNATGQAHRIGCINPHYFDNTVAVPSSLSLHNSQYDLRGFEEDATAANSSNSGSSLAINTHYYARETFGTNSIVLKIYTTAADRTNDTNVFRTCTCSNIDVMRIQAVGAFVRYNTAGSVLKVYNFGGTLCDWYGHNKTATFDAVDFGATAKYIDFSLFSETSTGNVKYQIRTQETDGVWGDYWAAMTASELTLLQYTTPVYAFQVRAVFNDCTGANAASLTSLSIASSETNPYGAVPSTPTVAAVDDETGTSITVTFSGSDTGVTNYLYYKLRTATAWTSGGNRSGNGAIQVTGLTQGALYDFIGVSQSGTAYSLPSSVSSAWATDGVTGGPVIEVAELVKDELNNTSWTQTFTAERDYLAFKKLEDIKDLFVFVTPNAETISPVSRQADQNDIIIDVCISQADVSKAEVDALMDLIDEIHGHFMRIVLDSKYHCSGIAIDPVFDPDAMREEDRFISVMRMTFAYRRAV